MPSPQITNPDAGTNLIIVMGVSGSGKSTLAQRLARHYGYTYLDGDDFHSAEARARMASGQPLTDEMRAPWVKSMCAYLSEALQRGENCVLAFSGLRQAHRAAVRLAGLRTLVLFLDGNQRLIQDRVNRRSNHFMAPDLVSSQFDSLEDPRLEPDVIVIDVTPGPDEVAAQAIEKVDRYLLNA